MLKIRLRLALTLCVGVCALTATAVQATSVPACPVGQVPNWNNTGCMAVQQNPSYSGFGLPSGQKAYLPGGTVNSNPAIQDCNGVPIPLGSPCSAAKPSLASLPLSSVASTIATQTSPATGSTSPSPTITVSAGSASGAVPSSSSTTAPPTESAATAAAVAGFTDPIQTLQGLLGDWYTGWLQYAAAVLNLNFDAQKSVSTTFLAFPSCLQEQPQACEEAIWQSLSQWLGPNLNQATAGS